MSFRAVTEAVVHFETFRNVDLFHQGIYFLRTSLYYQKDNQVSLAAKFLRALLGGDHLFAYINLSIIVVLCVALHGVHLEAEPTQPSHSHTDHRALSGLIKAATQEKKEP